MKLPKCLEQCFKAESQTRTGNSCKDCCPKSECRSTCCVCWVGRKVQRSDSHDSRIDNAFNTIQRPTDKTDSI